MAKRCSISPNEKQIADLYQFVFKRMSISKGKPFDYKALMLEVYNHRIKIGKSELDAIGFAEQIPALVQGVLEQKDNKELKNAMRAQGFSLDALADDVRDIDAAIEKKDSVPLIRSNQFLNLSSDIAGDLAAAKEAIAEDKLNETPVKKEVKPNVNIPVPIPNDLAATQITMERFKAATPSMFTDTDQEALSKEPLLPNGQPNPNFNVPNPDVAFYYKVKRKILERMFAENKTDSSEITLPGVGKVFLKIQSSSVIPEDERRVFVDLDKYGNPEEKQLSPAEKEKAIQKGVVMVITDEYGYPVRFNEEGEVDWGGKIAYYTLKSPKKDFSKPGKFWLSESDENSIKSRARLKNEPYEVAKAYIMQELKALEDLRDYINKNPKDNHLMATIVGGSLGYTQFDYKTIDTRINAIAFGEENFNPQVYEIGARAGTGYFKMKGMGDKPIEIERPAVKDRTDILETLISVLTDELIERHPSGKGTQPVSVKDIRQFVDTHFDTKKETIQVFDNEDGSYTVRLKGEKLDRSQASKDKLREFFTQPGPQRQVKFSSLTPEQKKKIVKPGDAYSVNSVLEVKDPATGESQYFVIEYPKINIYKPGLGGMYDKFALSPAEGGKVMVTKTPDQYNNFIKNNFTIHYELNAENKLLRLNAYFNYNITEKEEEKVYGKDETVQKLEEKTAPTDNLTEKGPADSADPDDLIDDAINNPLLKNNNQKHANKEATKEQMEAAKTWYENHPLSKHIPFKAMFAAINTKHPDSVASFELSGITLYKGSDFTDLYHEAWHAFTQTFLTKEQKRDLYREVQNMTGSFTDYKGNRVEFKKAKPRQIEEYLAEDFRQFMLSGKIAKPTTLKKTIFQKILDILKVLFSDLTWNEVVLNRKATKTVHDLYEKMRVGNLSEYSFSAQNTVFNTLYKGMEASSNEEVQKFLNYENSAMLVDTVDSLISQYIDLSNTGLKGSERKTLSDLLDKQRLHEKGLGKPLTPEERTSMEALKSKQTYRKTTTIVQTKEGRKLAYNYVRSRLAQLHEEWTAKLAAETNETSKELIKNKIETLAWAVKNFGNTDDLTKNKRGKDVIGYHIVKSKFFPTEEKEKMLDEMGDEEKFDRTGYDKSGNEISLKDLASKEILYLLRSLHKKNKDGSDDTNELGVPKLVPFDQVWNRLARVLQNTLDVNEMYNLLQEESKTYPAFRQLLLKLGPVDTAGKHEYAMWTNFWQTFNKSSVPLIQMTVETTTKDENGNLLDKPSYYVVIGDASGVHHKVGQVWSSYFATTTTNKYIRPGEGNNNYLDVPAVLKEFRGNIKGREFEFFNAIGVLLDDIPEIREAVQSGVGKAEWILKKLGHIHYDYKEQILNLKDIFKDRENLIGPNGKVIVYGTGEGKNWNELLRLQSRYSDQSSNFMVTNAEGNTQFEHTLNNSMTVVINTINNAPDYRSLIALPHMSYLDVRRNPWVKASTWLNSVFMLQDANGNLLDASDPNFGKKRKDLKTGKDVKINITNLSGVALKEDGDFAQGGISSASADEFTKLILDFHLTLKGQPELMRHADKGTSFSVWLSNIFTRGGEKKLYVDTTSFITRREKLLTPDDRKTLDNLIDKIKGGETLTPKEYEQAFALLNLNATPGFSEAFNIIVPHLSAELERINYMKNLVVDERGFDFDYKERGQDFVTFDRALSESTKEELKKLDMPLMDYLAQDTDVSNDLKSKIYNDMLLYFEVQTKEARDLMAKVGNFVADTAINEIQGAARNVMPGASVDVSMAKAAAIKSFVFNSWIHNLESLTVLYGDLALYKVSKEEFHKRNAGIGSTGDIYRNDQAARDYINNVLGKPYTEKMVGKTTLYTGVLNSAVVTDSHLPSQYLAEYKEAIANDIRTRMEPVINAIENPSEKAAKKAQMEKSIEDAVNAYTGMDEGDAQGWISFDSYRVLLNAQGKWTDAHEEMYKKIVEDGYVPAYEEIETFFATQKLQYWGPLKTEGIPIMAFHKFSLFPLIPTVIKGKNLEDLHMKMMKEGTDYALFKTGSKIGSIASTFEIDKKTGLPTNKTDEFYSDTKARTISNTPFTPNYVYVEYLKNQLEIAPEYKGQVVFSTQMRKLIEDGLVEGGVPTDFKPGESLDARRAAWAKITNEDNKKAASPRYRLMKTYEDNIEELTRLKKEELLKQMGWTVGPNGKPQGSLDSLIKFVKTQLTAQDLADHELAFIGTIDGRLENDLSMSLSADKIERMLNALVIKRLVRQKVNGEGLIQVSGAGFENKEAYTNPNQKDLAKWGTNDLPSYRKPKGKDGKPDYSKATMAMKVKVALQGNFTKLLSATHNDGEQIRTRERLNEMLKSEEWLNKDDNRRMITMVGVRIPVQGLNSMEFMEVYEFLPEEAGNIIVPPAEIVAKSGSDFDIDKLSVMMPTYQKRDGKVVINRGYTRLEAKALYEEYKKKRIERANSDLIEYIEEMDWEVEKILNQTGDLKTFEDYYATLNTGKAIENDLIWNIKEILALPENYAKLIRPNGTDIVKTLADKLADEVMEYKPKDKVFPSKTKGVAGTRVLEIQYNLYKHGSNNIGKQTLGLGAVDNTYNALFNRIGAYMNAYSFNERAAGISKKQFDALAEKKAKGERLTEEQALAYKKGLENLKPQTMRLKHNTLDVDGNKVISLSNLVDADGQHVISDVISQLINGWVDIAKDAWIFNIQGNKEVAPTLLFMIQAGVPFETAVYLVSQPMVREYVRQQRLAKSTFAGPLGKAPSNPMYFRSKALEFMLSSPKYGFNIAASQLKGGAINNTAYAQGVKLAAQVLGDGQFSSEELKKRMTSTEVDDYQRAAFLQFIEIENMSKAVRDVKMRMNFDTTKDATLFEAQNRILMIEALREDNRLPESIVNDLLKASPIKSFYIQPFQMEIWKDLFKLRDNQVLNTFLADKFKDRGTKKDVDDTFGDAEKFANEFRNDIVSYIFQNAINDFNLDTVKTYMGYKISEGTPVKEVKSLTIGAFVSGGKMYIDKTRLKTIFNTQSFSKAASTKTLLAQDGTATIPTAAFTNENDFYHFVLERENLRSLYPFETAKNLNEFENFARVFDESIPQLKEEVTSAWEKRKLGTLYEMWLRDKALDNVNNGWKLFESKNTYADQFIRLYHEFPELRERFSLMNSLVLTSTQKPGKNGFTNLKLADPRLDGDQINVLYENLMTLRNPTEQKVANFEDNQRISEFFDRFDVVAFLQSGLSAKSAFSMTRIVPQDKFLAVMKKPVEEYSAGMNDTILQDFYEKFVLQNNIRSKSKRVRYKNYISQMTLAKSKRTAPEVVTTQNTRITPYDENYDQFNQTGLTEAIAIKMQEENPDSVFVFNNATLEFGNATRFDTVFYKSPLANKFGLPTRKRFTGGYEKEAFSDIDGKPDPEFMKQVDVAVAALAEVAKTKKLVFNSAGYGQYLNTPDAKGKVRGKENFLYLSQQLYEKLNYVNPGYNRMPEGMKVIQASQEISDEMVRDFMKHCLI